jgi:sterol desaturase/sphingolipid hydroxylase (fatty acid hydroxylase superfamily)
MEAYWNQINQSFTQAIGQFQGLENRLELLSLVLFAIILIEVILDFALNQQRNYKETFANIGIGVIQEGVNSLVANAVGLVGLSLFALLSPWHLPINAGTILLAVILTDFCYYWNHRAEHRMRLFWAHHSVHHSSTDFNLTVALRLSWVENLILWIFYIPLALIGFHPLLILIGLEIGGLYQVWIHNQKIGRLGILELVINTASNHRVHHGANLTYIDKNYGGIFMIWDQVFGTYQPETEKVYYGLTENIGTSNIFKINWMGYRDMFATWRRSRNWQERLWSIFGPPEWKPPTL